MHEAQQTARPSLRADAVPPLALPAFVLTFFDKGFFYGFPDNLFNIRNNRLVQTLKGFFGGG
jgi:hypothetical protein